MLCVNRLNSIETIQCPCGVWLLKTYFLSSSYQSCQRQVEILEEKLTQISSCVNDEAAAEGRGINMDKQELKYALCDSVCVCVCVRACMYVCMYMCVYRCVCACVCLY